MSFDIHIAKCLNYLQHQIKQNNRKLFGQKSALICVNLRIIFVSLSDIPVTTYEKAAAVRFRTRMTQIAWIFTDPCASVSSAQSVFYCPPPVSICVHPRSFAEDLKPAFGYEKINNELVRTRYELTLPEFVSVLISSLFFSCSFINESVFLPVPRKVV